MMVGRVSGFAFGFSDDADGVMFGFGAGRYGASAEAAWSVAAGRGLWRGIGRTRRIWLAGGGHTPDREQPCRHKLS